MSQHGVNDIIDKCTAGICPIIAGGGANRRKVPLFAFRAKFGMT
ncbi:MAG TPA: hypothetical protein VH596_15710 [Terriglobales bacterium]|jgi:hypothetical protein